MCVGIGFPSFNTGSNLFFFGGTFARRRRIDINATDFFVRFPSFFFGIYGYAIIFSGGKNLIFFLDGRKKRLCATLYTSTHLRLEGTFSV